MVAAQPKFIASIKHSLLMMSAKCLCKALHHKILTTYYNFKINYHIRSRVTYVKSVGNFIQRRRQCGIYALS